MSIELEPQFYFGWEGFRLHDENLDAGIIPSPGGRLISLKYKGTELLFVQSEHAGKSLTLEFSDLEELRAAKLDIGFRVWGGDKTWVAPQNEWWEGIPPLDLDAGHYAPGIEDNAVFLLSPVCRETGLRIMRRIELHPGGELHLCQQLRNASTADVERGIWDVTQMLRPCDVYIPSKLEYVHPVAGEGDSAAHMPTMVSTMDDWVRIRCEAAVQFKYGIVPTRGELLVVRPNGDHSIGMLRTFDTGPVDQTQFAHGAQVEVYNSPAMNYLEVEVHAPMQMIPPGGQIEHNQIWRIGQLPLDIHPNEARRLLLADQQ